MNRWLHMALLALGASLSAHAQEAEEDDAAAGGVSLERAGFSNFREDLGTVGADGWVSADSDLVQVRVRFPGLYAEITKKAVSSFLPYDHKDSLYCNEGIPTRVRYLVSRARYAAATTIADGTVVGGAEKAFNDLAALMEMQAGDKDNHMQYRAHRYQGFSAFDVGDGGDGACTLQRVVLAGSDLIEMTVQGDTGACDRVSEAGGTFLNSLRLPGAATR